MTRIRFEDLPSTNTPRIAENFNKLNNVVISSTEPTTGEELWVQKGKNLFDGRQLTQSTYICPCKVGDIFTLSFTGSASSSDKRLFLRTYNGTFSSTLDSYVDNQTITLTSNNTDYSQTITSTTDGFVYIRTASGIGNYTLNNIQLELGSTATSYEAYIDKKIYTKNDNGVYEKFYDESEMNKETYSTTEQVIGTWIDGKPLYRMVVITAPETVNTWKYLPLTNNIDSCINIYGFYIPTNYTSNRRMILQSTNEFLVQTTNNGQLAIKTSDSNALTNWNIIIEYTKTTD